MLNSLSDIAKAKFHNEKIRIRAVVSGKSSSPYKIPRIIEVKCLGCDDPACKYKNTKELVIIAKDERFLLFIDVPTTKLVSIVKTVFTISCRRLSVKVTQTQNVLRIFVSQPPGEDRTKWMSAQTSYFVGHDIDANHTFYLSGYSTVDPKSQVATYVFSEAEKAKSDIESFELAPKVQARLEEFRQDVKDVDGVFAYLQELYDSYALNVTKIYGRFLLHLSLDLVFHSALEFTLPGGRIQPARLDAIILGDTRCGKGHVAEGLAKYYGIGEVVGAENCFSGNVKVLTKEYGSIEIRKVIGDITLMNRYGSWIKSVIKNYGKQQTVEAVFRHGSSRRAIKVHVTLNHNWRRLDGTKVTTKDLVIGDQIKFVRYERQLTYVSSEYEKGQDYKNGIVHGLIFGDGHGSRRGYSIQICCDVEDVLPYFDEFEKRVHYYPSKNGMPTVKLRKDYIEWRFKSTQNLKELPIGNESEAYLVGFFRGWLAADGNGSGRPGTGLTGDRKYLQWAMKIMPKFGYYFHQLKTSRLVTNFGVRKRDTCSVGISSLSLTADDFLLRRKAKRFSEYEHNKSDFTFRGITPNSQKVEDVYCANVPITHDFVLDEGLLTCNCTFAGLVGGAQQIGNHWVISWGRIPLNDRGLVIIDEASELKQLDWTRLSRIRSEGIAEVTKIQQQITNARCRLAFLANPPSKAMANYTFGIHALKDLVHAPEDIARFDFACIVSHEEVSIEDINKKHGTTKYLYPQNAERDLIMWIWSRSSAQIQFTDEAMDEVYKTATRLGKFYDIGIPLIQGENVRFKLAKIAIAFAGRLYSAAENGSVLKVKRLHIQCAATFLRGLYKADVNGYYDHSWQRKELNPDLQKENIDSLVAYFNAYQSQDDAYQYLLNNTYVNARDIQEHLNVTPQIANEIISKLIKFKCIVKKDTSYNSSAYIKTSHFTRWLRDRVRALRRKQ